MLMEHNVKIYEQFEEMLINRKECILVTATGTGKSYIALEFIQKYNCKALVICPKVAVCKAWKKRGLDSVTYNKFTKDWRDFLEYNCYIFDEAHHMGGPIWRECIFDFLETIDDFPNDVYTIGLTANSKRYFNDKDDIADLMFNGNVVYGYSLDNAIEKGILPSATYVYALFDLPRIGEMSIVKNATKVLRGRLSKSIKNSMNITEILQKHMPEKRKCIVFTDSIKSVEYVYWMIKATFPNDNISYIHSKLSKKEVNETMEAFETAESGFIVTVDMFNEGLHIDGVNVAIMLRKTSSPNIYMQQIGRTLKPGNQDIFIFDFVGNTSSVSKTISEIEESKSEIEVMDEEDQKRRFGKKISDQSIIYDYASPILTILEEIEKESKPVKSYRYYSKEELDILKEYYPKEGSDVVNRLPNRDRKSVVAKAFSLGISYHGSIWSNEEIEILREKYPIMGTSCYILFNNKTRSQCHNKAKSLGIRYCNLDYNKEEDDIIRKYYPSMGKKCNVYLNNRTEESVLKRAIKLKVKLDRNEYCWSKHQIDTIRNLYQKIGAGRCSEILGISPHRCTKKAKELGLDCKFYTRWKKSEDNILMNTLKESEGNYSKLSDLKQLLEERLPGRSFPACRRRIEALKNEK